MRIKNLLLSVGACLALTSLLMTFSAPAQAAGRAATGQLSTSAPKGEVVALETNHGTIEIKLFRKQAPITTANFLRYVRSGHYNGTIFHRVIPNFMIQGGGFTTSMRKKPTGKPIRNEATNRLANKRGTIAMARLPSPHSATAQFFINVKYNFSLDHQGTHSFGYCVFGKVVKGMNVVDKIRYLKTRRRGAHGNVPIRPAIIKRARVVR